MEDKRKRYQFERCQFNLPEDIHIQQDEKCVIEITMDRNEVPRLAKLVVVKNDPHIRIEYNFEQRKIVVYDLDFNITFKRYLKSKWERIKLLFR